MSNFMYIIIAILSYLACAQIKNIINFPHLSGNSEESGAKSYMTNGLLICGEKFAHFLIY
jgi:hypothetical protein